MILLIRHCKPKINYSKCNYQEVLDKVKEYNTTNEILNLVNQVHLFLQDKNPIILSSNMPRALITTKSLFKDRQDIIFDSKFIEFDLNIVPLPIVKLKFATWATISRILSFLRLLKSNRSIKSEMKRAQECAELVYKKADAGFPVVLVPMVC